MVRRWRKPSWHGPWRNVDYGFGWCGSLEPVISIRLAGWKHSAIRLQTESRMKATFLLMKMEASGAVFLCRHATGATLNALRPYIPQADHGTRL